MPDESTQAKTAETKERAPRSKSTIEFPYLDLDNAVEIARSVRNFSGEGCSTTQLAAKLNVSAEGGGFRMRLFNAKTFGLLSYERGNLTLTPLGVRAADPVTERRGRYDAFMAVVLFKQLFDKLEGQTLPPAAAIERMMEQMGVAPTQKERARQVFQRSAKQAALFELANDRLTTPPNLGAGPRDTAPADTSQSANKFGGSGTGGNGGDDDGAADSDSERFEIPIPGKRSVRVIVPHDLDADDWVMLQSMISVYIKRWKGFADQANLRKGEGEGA